MYSIFLQEIDKLLPKNVGRTIEMTHVYKLSHLQLHFCTLIYYQCWFLQSCFDFILTSVILYEMQAMVYA